MRKIKPIDADSSAPNTANQTAFQKLQSVLLDNADLQALLHVSPNTLYNWRKSGLLFFIKIQGRIYYYATDIENLLQQRRRTGVS